jgi:hypothetical protein
MSREDFRDASIAYAAPQEIFDFKRQIPILAIAALHQIAPTRAITDFL